MGRNPVKTDLSGKMRVGFKSIEWYRWTCSHRIFLLNVQTDVRFDGLAYVWARTNLYYAPHNIGKTKGNKIEKNDKNCNHLFDHLKPFIAIDYRGIGVYLN